MAGRELPGGVQVAPSILAADFARLAEQVASVLDAGARVIHVDVMDGHFVPPITIGPLICDAIAGQVHEVGGVLDVHLMVERPSDHVAAFASAGADAISFHVEADPHAHRTAAAIREAGCLAGIAINPGTAVESVGGLAGAVDFAVAMSVNPGWGGQAFIPGSPRRIERLAELLPETPIEVDGGVDRNTAGAVAAAGATLLVAGSAVFRAPDAGDAVRAIAAAAEAAQR